jgi:uncharacterized membrane protein YccC
MVALAFTYARNALRATDPDLGRFRMGARALLAAIMAAAVLTTFERLVHVPTVFALPGVDVAVLGSLMVNDQDRRDQRVTQLFVPVVAGVSTVVATLLAPYHLVSSLVFLVVIFLAVIVRRFGARGQALGMVGFITFFIALFFHVPPRALPFALVGIAISGLIAYVVRFVIIVDRPVPIARGLRDALVRSLSLSLGRMSRRLDGTASDKSVSRALRRTNDGALVLDDHLESPGSVAIAQSSIDELRAYAFEAEVASERVANALAGFPAGSYALADILWRTRLAIRQRRIDAEAPGLENELVALADPARRSWGRMVRAYHDVVAAIRGLRAARIVPAREPRPAPERAEEPPPPGLHPATRQAIQATIAGGLAMIAGSLISTTRWYWAVVAAFVMYTRTTTRGETLVRGFERVLGTAVGVVGGVWLGSWFAGHSRIELAIIFVCVFVAYYFLQTAYTGMVIALTLLLAALYGLLGRFAPGILYVRLAETLAGCAIGAAVAVFVLPASTSGKLRAKVNKLLGELADIIDAAFDPRSVPARAAVRDQARELDRTLRELRLASRPLVGPFMHVSSDRPAEIVHLISTAWYFARHLVMYADAPLAPAARTILDALTKQVAANARAAARGGPQNHVADEITEARDKLVAAGVLGAGPASARAALDRLARVEGALCELAAVLATDALQRRSASASRSRARPTNVQRARRAGTHRYRARRSGGSPVPRSRSCRTAARGRSSATRRRSRRRPPASAAPPGSRRSSCA